MSPACRIMLFTGSPLSINWFKFTVMVLDIAGGNGWHRRVLGGDFGGGEISVRCGCYRCDAGHSLGGTYH